MPSMSERTRHPSPGRRWPPSWRAVVVSVVALALIAALSIVLFAGRGSNGPASRNGSRVLLPASASELPTFDAKSFRRLLTQLRGKPVVVNFWGSWCGPCRQEAPGLATVSRTYQGRVQFIGVDVLDNVTEARIFIGTYHWTYPSVFDPSAAIKNSFGLLGQPVTILFDASGKQVFVNAGAIAERTLQRELEGILGS
jgi:cytochrome c biogenesis protein CcmG/thiol:disulfide interchange protein DsbE